MHLCSRVPVGMSAENWPAVEAILCRQSAAGKKQAAFSKRPVRAIERHP